MIFAGVSIWFQSSAGCEFAFPGKAAQDVKLKEVGGRLQTGLDTV